MHTNCGLHLSSSEEIRDASGRAAVDTVTSAAALSWEHVEAELDKLVVELNPEGMDNFYEHVYKLHEALGPMKSAFEEMDKLMGKDLCVSDLEKEENVAKNYEIDVGVNLLYLLHN